ncbi:MAG: rhamnulokinase [Faecalibacterium sp.]|nr:rhamnulokinase [Ruminococcus sp.]MCM1392221.1 rhamnulokinase [Ruminococcus sp.]MCM1485918.1 rhamnulokinase [Faecalibacterium sp.]
MSKVLAFDFGASTGRAIKAEFDGKKLTYSEVHRFENIPTHDDNGHLCWNFPYLIGEVKKAIDMCGKVDSLAFDTWGVDYGLLDENDNLIGLPVNYRDTRTNNVPEKVFEKISACDLYETTGNQIMPINTLFQLVAEDKKSGKTLLFMPDLFVWALCGNKSAERTIASTSQMYDFNKNAWAHEIADINGIDASILQELVDSSVIAGEYNGIKVIKVAGHDTQCAIAAMPADKDKCSAFLSCGTWSLIGCELESAVLTEKSMADELSNEFGANGKVDYLKNISGLWLIQEIRRNFKAEGKAYTFNDMEQLAKKEKPFCCFIDPDAPEFATAGKMPEKIRNYCERTNQTVPQSDGALVRCIYESLAMKYKFAIEQIEENTDKNFEVLHLLGGGTKDGFLCQMTADSLGFPVVAGPCEATALGNILLQLIALGDINNIDEGRALIKTQESVKTYFPTNNETWLKAYKTFCTVLQKTTINNK